MEELDTDECKIIWPVYFHINGDMKIIYPHIVFLYKLTGIYYVIRLCDIKQILKFTDAVKNAKLPGSDDVGISINFSIISVDVCGFVFNVNLACPYKGGLDIIGENQEGVITYMSNMISDISNIFLDNTTLK